MKTEIICILDHSGSMGALRHDVIGGFNTFLADQKKVAGQARITFVRFDSAVRTLFEAVPIEQARALTVADYAPGGSTALFDAIGMTVSAQKERIKAEGWAELVIVNIITDGENNCSTVYSAESVKTAIDAAQENDGWVFLFQAANQDAFTTGGGLGISAVTTSNFVASAAGMRDAYGATSGSVTRLRSAPATALDDALANMAVPPAQPWDVLPDAGGTAR